MQIFKQTFVKNSRYKIFTLVPWCRQHNTSYHYAEYMIKILWRATTGYIISNTTLNASTTQPKSILLVTDHFYISSYSSSKLPVYNSVFNIEEGTCSLSTVIFLSLTYLHSVMELSNQRGFSSGLLGSRNAEMLNTERLLLMYPFILSSPFGW